MDINLDQLKTNFLTIKDIRLKVSNVFNILESHLMKLKQTYKDFVKHNKQNLFVFGLDSFQFQSKLIDIEFDELKRLFLAINNRMYCEYYKLYKIITEYVKENILDKKTIDMIKLTNNFAVYKDLEPYKEYKFELTQEIHENIILILFGINDYITNKEIELSSYQKTQEIGLNINNFVTTFNFNILMMREKCMLFISYIKFFHNLHTKYLQRFAMKMNLMYSQVTHDIRFEETTSETKKQELLNQYEVNNVDKKLIKQIKKSLDDGDSSGSEMSISEMQNEEKISNEVIQGFPKPSMKKLFKKNVHKVLNSLRMMKDENKSDNKFENKSDVEFVKLTIQEPSTMTDFSSVEKTFSIDVMCDEINNKCNELQTQSQTSTPVCKHLVVNLDEEIVGNIDNNLEEN